MSASQIFVSNRALGYVSNHIPLVTRFIKRRNENLVVTCVGRAFHTYGCAHFSLLSVSIQLEEDITCLGADTFHVYTACGPVIQAWRRGTELKHTYKGHTHNVHLLLPFGPHLISVDEGSNVIVWDVKDEDIYLNMSFLDEEFHITTILHPSTYLNKILLGSEQGELQLWNIKTSKMIYKFGGWGSPVTALEQSPAVDVVAIGLADGRIFLHNLKFDETVLSLVQDWGTVTSISFRLDGRPIMATGSVSGHIVFWDLEKRTVASQQMNAHEASVAGMEFLPNEPLMVTSSPDNTLKMWIFDLSDDGARLLRLREGHAAPPTHIRFHGSNGHNILSSGNDSSLRIFNTQLETFNKSLGRASYNRKASKKKGKRLDTHVMPPITSFDSVTIRDKEWDSIAAVHRGLPMVTTWSYDKLRMGELKLVPEKLKPKNHQSYVPPMATCLTVTNCGNFVVIGYSTGHLERFNIQSGIHRCSYGTSTAHKGAVRGVVVDGNGQVVVSGGADGSVKFWIFKTTGVLHFASVAMEEPVTFFTKHRESSLVCIALDDFSLCLLDIDTRKVVRRFMGHTGQLNDATFSPDMRWLVSAAMDSSIRVWDIPTGQLVDCFKVPYACISLSFSPTGEFLATAHVDNLGLYLWSNRTLFTHVSLKPLPHDIDIEMLQLPSTTQSTSNVGELDDIEEEKDYQSPDHLEDHLISFSSLANSRWQNLLDLDVIKKRNKPKEAPKAPKAAPFFLPTLPALNLQFDLRDVERDDGVVKKIDLNKMMDNHTAFGKLLVECGKSGDFSQALEKLKSMGPSAVDFEVNSLYIEGSSSTLLDMFMRLIKFVFNSNRDFELGQAYLGLFLKVHGEAVATSSELSDMLSELQTAQESSWNRLQDRFSYCLSIVETLKIN